MACSAAGAEPAPGGAAAVPAGWRPLPAIATAAAAAAAKLDGVIVDGASAWGDPARGCYAVQLGLRGGTAAITELADQVLDGLAGSKAAGSGAVSFGEVIRPAASGDTLSFTFARPPYRGRLRARLGEGSITALACFGNQRDPARCDAACARMLQN